MTSNGYTSEQSSFPTSDDTPPTTDQAEHDSGTFLDATPEDLKLATLYQKLQESNIEESFDLRLPWIVVCGSQSAGKSSVLEAITTLPFPSGRGTCTRFITKIITKPSEITDEPTVSKIQARILPSEVVEPGQRNESQLLAFNNSPDLLDLDFDTGFRKLLERASKAILGREVQHESVHVTADILEITLIKPGIRSLTMIDLPGLIGSDKLTGARDKIKKMTEKFLKLSDSFIVIVTPASAELGDGTDAPIWDICSGVDPNYSERSICIITKPDKAEKKEDAAEWVAALSEEPAEDAHFKGPYHVLMNYYDSTNPKTRREQEAQFFDNAHSPWYHVPKDRRGAFMLQEFLGQEQQKKWREHLPKLQGSIGSLLDKKQVELEKLVGDGQDSGRVEDFQHMRKHLRKDVENHLNEHYVSLRGDHGPAEDGPCYLRSRITDEEEFFRDNLVQYAYRNRSWICPEIFGPGGQSRRPHALKSIPRVKVPQQWLDWPKDEWKTAADEVLYYAKKLANYRGRSGQRRINSNIDGELSEEMSRKWKIITHYHLEQLVVRVHEYFREVVRFLLEHPKEQSPGVQQYRPFPKSKRLAEELFNRHIKTELDKRVREAKQELAKLESDRLTISLTIDEKSFDDQRMQEVRMQFEDSLKAARVLGKDAQDPSMAHKPLEGQRYAEAANGFEQGQWFDKKAVEHAFSAYRAYERGRDHWAINVVNQVFERHLFRDFSDLVEFKGIDDQMILDLLDDDTEEEKTRKTYLASEISTLEGYLQMVKDHSA